MTTLREEQELAEEFLTEMSKGLTEDERVMVVYAEEATVQTDERGKKVNSVFWPKPWLLGKPIMLQQNCYVCISSMMKTRNPRTGEMRFWRTESAFSNGMAMMVDDIGDGIGSKGNLGIETFQRMLPPTVIVETSPNNYQLWYFFEKPMDSLIHMKALLNAFVAHVLQKGGDNTIKDVTRVGRMPCGVNNKRTSPNGPYKYVGADGKPWRVRLHSKDYSRRYTAEQIARAFGFTIVLPQKKKIVIDENDWKFDAIWLQLAQKILERHQMGEGTGGEVVENMSGKYRIRCPWGDEHTNGDPYGAYFRGPIPGAEHEFVFGCAHDCHRKGEGKKGWTAFVDAVVMPYIEANLEAINKRAAGVK